MPPLRGFRHLCLPALQTLKNPGEDRRNLQILIQTISNPRRSLFNPVNPLILQILIQTISNPCLPRFRRYPQMPPLQGLLDLEIYFL